MYRRPAIDRCIEFCQENGIEPREHALAYERFFPKWMYNLPMDEAWSELEHRFQEISARYADKIPTIEVTNEVGHAPGQTALIQHPDYINRCFALAEKYFPHNQLGINEATRWAWDDKCRTCDKYYAYIENAMLKGAPSLEEILPKFLEFVGNRVLVAHNASFDMSFIIENSARLGYETDFTYVDTVPIARILLPGQAKHTLDAVAKGLGVVLDHHHRAVDDAEATAQIFVKMIPMLADMGVNDLVQLNEIGASSIDLIKKMTIRFLLIRYWIKFCKKWLMKV